MTTTTKTGKKNGEKAGQVARDRIHDAARAWASHMQASIAALLASLDAAAADCRNNPDLDHAINDDAFNDLCDSLGNAHCHVLNLCWLHPCEPQFPSPLEIARANRSRPGTRVAASDAASVTKGGM